MYEGSVVVEYEIVPDQTQAASGGSSDSAAQLRAIQKNLNTLIEEESDAFGAPILSAGTAGATVIEDPTYNPASKPATTTAI